jgi:hypothetical protein
MKRFYKTALPLVIGGFILLGSLDSSAVTREEMRTLDAAYPPGSIVNCEAELAGNGKNLLPMTTKIRGHIISRAEKSKPRRCPRDVHSSWLINGNNYSELSAESDYGREWSAGLYRSEKPESLNAGQSFE